MKISVMRILVSVLLITIVFSVHLKNHNEYNVEDYLQALQDQQDRFETGISELKNSVANVDDQVNQTAAISQKISLLQNAIVDQEDQIFQLSTNMIPPLNLSTCNCEALSQEDRQNLAQRADAALQKVQDLKTELDSLEEHKNDPQFSQMQRNADSQIFYLQSIKEVLNSNCTTEAILTPTVYQSNIYAQNWILGDQDINDLVQTYIDRSKVSDSITNCPIDQPFYDGNDCINCAGETPVFNMETQECVSCPPKSELDTKTRKCKQTSSYMSYIFTNRPWISDDGDTTRVLQENVDKMQSNDYQICPKENPFVVDGECTSCQYGQIYNIDIRKCIVPNEDVVYNANTHSLLHPQDVHETNPNAKRLLAAGQLPDIEQIPNCPIDRPYYDDIACIECPYPMDLFNTATKRCVTCSAYQFYNAEEKTCETRPILYENGNYLNLVGLPHSSNQEYLQKIAELQDQHPEGIVSVCGQTQNSAFTSCMQCEDDQLFNTGTLSCVKCENLDVDKKVCYDGVYFEPYLGEDANGTVIVQEQEGQGSFEEYKENVQSLKSEAVDSIQCTAEQPQSDGTKCFKCPDETPIFNTSSNECVKCPKKAPFDPQTFTCKEAEAFFLSNPESAINFVGSSNQEVSDYFDQAAQNAQSVPNPQICGDDKPYSDGYQCFACQEPNPLFNVTSEECTHCPQGKDYIPDENTCGECPDGTAYDSNQNKCIKLNVKFISNPGTGLYTGSSQEQVDSYLDGALKETQTYPNAVVCPHDKPHSNGDQCLACDDEEKPYFDVNSLECVGCPENSLYNEDTFVCEDCGEGYALNEEGTKCIQVATATNINSFDRVIIPEDADIEDYQAEEGQLTCDEDAPFYNGQECVACQDNQSEQQSEQGPLLFNLETKECERCPEGSTYVSANYRCQYPGAMNPNATSNVIISNGTTIPQVDEDTVVTCPIEKPYFDGENCISCDEDNYIFDLTNLKCTQCPEGTILDKSIHQCVEPTRISNFQAGGNRIEIQEGQDYDELRADQEGLKNLEVCPVSAPFFDGSECIDCQVGEVFNLQTSQCQECPEFRRFDKETHICQEQEFISDFENRNWLAINPVNQQKDNQESKDQGVAVCPEDRPFSIGTSCINCQNGTSFDEDKKECVHCPEGQILDTNIHVCVTPTSFVTNLQKAPNLIYDGVPEDELKALYDTAKNTQSNVADCPEDTPYYNGASCITCTGTRPFFNMAERICQDCAEGTHYDQAEHECIDDVTEENTAGVDTTPSFEKLAANIFSHRNKNKMHRMH